MAGGSTDISRSLKRIRIGPLGEISAVPAYVAKIETLIFSLFSPTINHLFLHTAAMSPSFEGLAEDNGTYDSEEEIDFSDLREQYDVRLEQGLDAFVVVDGLPVVPEASKAKLITYITKKLNAVGRVKDEGFYMPTNDKGMTEGYDSPDGFNEED